MESRTPAGSSSAGPGGSDSGPHTHMDPDQSEPTGVGGSAPREGQGTRGACRGRGSLFLSRSYEAQILFSEQIVQKCLRFPPRYQLPE